MIRTFPPLFVLAASLALIPSALAGPGGPYQFSTDFNSNQRPAGLQLYGSAAVDNQSLLLTSNAPGQAGLAIIGGGKIPAFGIAFSYFFDRPGGGLTADGMSFTLGLIPDGVGGGVLWEKGSGSGVTVSFDIYDFPDNGSLATYGIRIIRDGAVIASATNAMTQADRGQWRNVAIGLNADGTMSVYYNGATVFTNVQTGYVADPRHRFAFAARTGGESAEQRVDNILLTPNSIVSADTCQNPSPIAGDGCYWFDTLNATTDGIAACDSVGVPGNSGITKDVWFCWTAAATGIADFSTVGHANWDTKMALYNDCGACPEGLGLLNCNDNSGASIQAELSQRVVAGHKYLLRLGGSPGSADGQSGNGYIVVATTPDCPGDFNHSGQTSVQDLFDFLAAWFAHCP